MNEYDLNTFFSKDVIINGSFMNLENSDTKLKSSLAYCDSLIYLKKAIKNENVSAIITTPDLSKNLIITKPHALAKNPRASFYKIFNIIAKEFLQNQNHDGKIGNNTYISESAIVSKEAIIGSNCVISSGAIIGSRVQIGDNVTIGPGAVIGTDGILFNNTEEKREHIIHFGNVIIEDDVTILANATIVYGITPNNNTKIGKNSYIGIGSIIGHEAIIESNCIISGNCVIARRVHIKDDAYIGTNSMIREYIEIGEKAKVMAGSVVIENVKDKINVSGNFAINHMKRLKEYQRNK